MHSLQKITGRRPLRTILFFCAAMLLASSALSESGSENFSHTTLLLIVLITLADWCGLLFERLGLPELVGEIFAGILLGNLALASIDFDIAAQLRNSGFMQYASQLAVVLLLFLVGLQVNSRELLKVGSSSLKVALAGVVLPLLLGVAASRWLGIGGDFGSWFIGAMLTATSVGISARQLGDNHLVKTTSARVILGAAVIDDILGIILLAVLASIAIGGTFSAPLLTVLAGKVMLFFLVAFLVSRFAMPTLVHMTSLSKHSSFWVGSALCFVLISAELASWAGLAPLIGGFVAGLVLNDTDFAIGEERTVHRVEEMLKPMTDILLTIFFVGIGTQVDLAALASVPAITAVSVLLMVAIVSKVAAGFSLRDDQVDQLGIGFAMTPRGEVGLIFAAFAFDRLVFDAQTYSILIMVILLTTIIGPLLLQPRLRYFK